VVLNVSDRANISAALSGIFDSQITGGKRYDLAVDGRRRANATFGDSHSVDAAEGIILAMDLTGLFHDDTASPVGFIESRIEALRADVVARLRKVAAG